MTCVGACFGEPDLSRTRDDRNYRLSFLFDYLWVVLPKAVLQSIPFNDMSVEILNLRKVEKTLSEAVFRYFFCVVKKSHVFYDEIRVKFRANAIGTVLAAICYQVISRKDLPVKGITDGLLYLKNEYSYFGRDSFTGYPADGKRQPCTHLHNGVVDHIIFKTKYLLRNYPSKDTERDRKQLKELEDIGQWSAPSSLLFPV